MNQKSSMLNINNLREKLSLSPKKCIYKIERGEIIIYHIEALKRCIA